MTFTLTLALSLKGRGEKAVFWAGKVFDDPLIPVGRGKKTVLWAGKVLDQSPLPYGERVRVRGYL